MFGLHYRHLVAWALAILLTLGGAATSVAAPPADRGSAGAPVFVEEPVRQRLLGRVGNRMPGRERMRVMVSIDSADEPDVHLRGWQFRNPVARSARQRAIASLQDRVLHGLGARQGRMLHRFRHVPYISLDIDAAELEILEATPGVVSIREDTLMRPFLNDSAPQLDAPHAWSLGAAGAGQAVAVLDTGVDTSHPAFVGRVIADACFSTTDGVGGTSLCPNGEEPDGRDWQVGTGAGVNCTGVSSCDHGTHVAGIAASADAHNGYFATGGVDSAPLRALADGEDGANGVYRLGDAGVFPDQAYQSTNFWADVVFAVAPGP